MNRTPTGPYGKLTPLNRQSNRDGDPQAVTTTHRGQLGEVWFGIIGRQPIHRDTFGSVKDLNAKIRAFVNGWNDRCHPFAWAKTTEPILKKAKRRTTSNADH